MRIYGDEKSGNCLKVKWVCDYLRKPYTWIEIDTLKAETRTAEFLKLNPAGQVPTVVFDDGRALAQSNAIIRHLARDSDLIPADPFAVAKMDEWLFWEQYSHEPYVAVCRFQMVYLGKPVSDLDPDKVKRGYAALALMNAPTFDEQTSPYREAAVLVEFRNALIHHKPTWDAQRQRVTDLVRELTGQFSSSPFMSTGNDFISEQCMSAGCAQWCVSTAIAFMSEFEARTHLEPDKFAAIKALR